MFHKFFWYAERIIFIMCPNYYLLLSLLAGRPEHTVSRKYDPRSDDSRDRRAGYEENWPSQKHTHGYEAQPGDP